MSAIAEAERTGELRARGALGAEVLTRAVKAQARRGQ